MPSPARAVFDTTLHGNVTGRRLHRAGGERMSRPVERISIGLVGCAATKAETAAPARRLYISDLFRKASAYAEATYDLWRIMSAQHYLLHPDEVIEPYDKRVDRMPKWEREHWASMVESGLRCGHNYCTEGRVRWPGPGLPGAAAGGMDGRGPRAGHRPARRSVVPRRRRLCRSGPAPDGDDDAGRALRRARAAGQHGDRAAARLVQAAGSAGPVLSYAGFQSARACRSASPAVMPRRPGRTWARSANWPGVGSVCRQQRTGQIAATARLLGELGVDLHYFGVKLTGLTRPELQRDLRRPLSGGVASLDSESWSLEARYGTRRPDCTHLGRDGQPNKCNNCPAYAAWWAGGVTNAVSAGLWAASRRPQQTTLFSEYDLLADAP